MPCTWPVYALSICLVYVLSISCQCLSLRLIYILSMSMPCLCLVYVLSVSRLCLVHVLSMCMYMLYVFCLCLLYFLGAMREPPLSIHRVILANPKMGRFSEMKKKNLESLWCLDFKYRIYLPKKSNKKIREKVK